MILCIQSQAMNICIILSEPHFIHWEGKFHFLRVFDACGPVPATASTARRSHSSYPQALTRGLLRLSLPVPTPISSSLPNWEIRGKRTVKPLLTRRYVKNKCVCSQYWVFQFMNTLYLSFFFKILNFLISVLSFPHTCTYHQVIHVFYVFVNGIFKSSCSIYLLPTYGNTVDFFNTDLTYYSLA